MQILHIPDKCTGCTACYSVCPVNCIEMLPDKEGFLYPQIDFDRCIRCHKCEKVCPALRQKENTKSKKAYYGFHTDEFIRKDSSSGGVFSALAELYLSEGGVVFAAIFDENTKTVKHIGIDNSEYAKQRKSKYVQSDLKNTFKEVLHYLKNDKPVLYCGTPCQIDGLKSFLGKNYDNLLTVDFICHGVSSMKLLQEHLLNLEKKYKSPVTNIDFRPKTFGWSRHAIKIDFENNRVYSKPYNLDSYFKGFISSNMFLRKCCYNCEYSAHHVSDITLADFWGIIHYKPEINDEKGISLILPNTEKGEEALQKAGQALEIYPLDYKYAQYVYQKRTASKEIIDKRENFFKLYDKIGFEKAAYATFMNGAFKQRLKHFIKNVLKARKRSGT